VQAVRLQLLLQHARTTWDHKYRLHHQSRVVRSQDRIAVEKQRLASVRLPPADPLVLAASVTSGQPVTGVISLEEVLRRPHVHYP
jgi:hypothetical protein